MPVLKPPKPGGDGLKQAETEGQWTFESRNRRKDGTIFPVEVTATYGEFEGQEYVFAFIIDITERQFVGQRGGVQPIHIHRQRFKERMQPSVLIDMFFRVRPRAELFAVVAEGQHRTEVPMRDDEVHERPRLLQPPAKAEQEHLQGRQVAVDGQIPRLLDAAAELTEPTITAVQILL